MIDLHSGAEEAAVLPGDVPVEMPELPERLTINTQAQFRAVSDPMRARILTIILSEPVTAKQIATRLNATPGAIGHHLHVLEEAGLAKVMARRLVRGIVAKYYTRTARLFQFDMPPELAGSQPVSIGFLTRARDELADALALGSEDACLDASFTHVRLAEEKVKVYQERLNAILDDLLKEYPEAGGTTYSLSVTLFKAPPYLQRPATPEEPA